MKFIKRSFLLFFSLLGLLCLALLTQCHSDIPFEEMKSRYAPEPSQFMTIEGQRVHFRDQGKGAPVVLLHGMGASLHTWEPWVAALQDSFRLLSVDLPAFGLTGSHPQHDYRLEAYLDFVHRFAERLSLDTFSIVGNSLGGAIAWNYAAAHPERVHKLILIDAAGFPQPDRKPTLGVRLASTPGLKQIVRYVTPRSLIAKSMYEVYGDTSRLREEVIDRYYEMMLAEGNREAFIARQGAHFPFYRDKLEDVHQATLIQWGAKDHWIPVALGDSFAQALPNARLIIYPDAGHLPMEEIPERSVADARAFLLE